MKKLLFIMCFAVMQAQGASIAADSKAEVLKRAKEAYGKDQKAPSLQSFQIILDSFLKKGLGGRPLRLADQNVTYNDYYHYFLRNSNTKSWECETWKIHLMPKNYNLDFVYDFIKLMETNEKLKNRNLAYAYKILGAEYYKSDQPVIHTRKDGTRDIMPTIIIYTGGNYKYAQSLLNEIYKEMKGIEGSNYRPRYNGKVNDFIWFAQGNADNKGVSKEKDAMYQQPDLIYCSRFKDGKTLDDRRQVEPHYLIHPDTKANLVSPGESKPMKAEFLDAKVVRAQKDLNDLKNDPFFAGIK